ncbi:hypothetical protein KUTeg_008641 [Tegillarca granosa]|uniref:Uncharacterized protein n=1 Tax=Tegillarca granosa TaxID=220873 RepID=A0ABQ9FCS1_TEGGR|nr:hypothetical protein KUTeg_008641 [Tegillarca granosa]
MTYIYTNNSFPSYSDQFPRIPALLEMLSGKHLPEYESYFRGSVMNGNPKDVRTCSFILSRPPDQGVVIRALRDFK